MTLKLMTLGSAYVATKRKAPAFHHRNANLPNSRQSLDSKYDIAKSYAERFRTQPTPIEGCPFVSLFIPEPE